MYLVLSIVFTTLVFLILKEFDRYKIDNFQAIVYNYFVAFLIGSLFSNVPIEIIPYTNQPWTLGAFCIAVIFITVFNLMAITAQKGGLSIMTIANKMSVVIPIALGVVLYNETLGWIKLLGIVLALLGVWFTSKKQGTTTFNKRLWFLPFLIFVGSGVADAIINHTQITHVPKQQLAVFSTALFLFCGCIGVLLLVVKLVLNKITFSIKNIGAGIILGVPNYFSIYFLLKALAQPTYESSLVFSINNLLVVLLSVILGVVLYKEKLSKYNYLGIAMSLLAIVFLYVAI